MYVGQLQLLYMSDRSRDDTIRFAGSVDRRIVQIQPGKHALSKMMQIAWLPSRQNMTSQKIIQIGIYNLSLKYLGRRKEWESTDDVCRRYEAFVAPCMRVSMLRTPTVVVSVRVREFLPSCSYLFFCQ